MILISDTPDGTESYDRILVNQNLVYKKRCEYRIFKNINSSLKKSEELTLLFYEQREVILKEIHIKMVQSLEEINHKISTKFKLLGLTEKETKQLIVRKKSLG